MVPQTLNKLFAAIMQKPAFQKLVLKDARETAEEDGTDDEILDRAFGERYPAWMEDFKKRGSFLGDDLVLYRGLSAPSANALNLKRLGTFWTWDKAKAANYSDRNTSEQLFIVAARVPIASVNLEETLQKLVWSGYDFDESEREFTLKPGAKLEVLEVFEKGRAVKLELPQESLASLRFRKKVEARQCLARRPT